MKPILVNLKENQKKIDIQNSVSVTGKLPVMAYVLRTGKNAYSFSKNGNFGMPDGYLKTFSSLEE